MKSGEQDPDMHIATVRSIRRTVSNITHTSASTKRNMISLKKGEEHVLSMEPEEIE